jgi:hypothetical protein
MRPRMFRLAIAFLGGFGFAAAPAAAQAWWWPPQWQVDPVCPHPSNPITVQVSGQWPDLCPPDAIEVFRHGLQIDIRVTSPSVGPCVIPTISSWLLSEPIGILPAGVYEVYITHYFQQQPSTPRTFLGLIEVDIACCPVCPLPCYANCDGSTLAPVLNVADFSCFLQRFAAGDPYANCDGSTQPPLLNVADFACFLGQFAAGCR